MLDLKQWKRPYNIFVKCIRGLESCLERELNSFGFENDRLVKYNRGITILNGSLRQLYFLSYFSRISTGIYVELGNLLLENKKTLLRCCREVDWRCFIGSKSTYLVNCNISDNSSFIKSKIYACQLVKDGINDYFRVDLKQEPPKVMFNQPDVKLELNIDDKGEAKILIDSIGKSLSSRPYRYKPVIGDIDPTVACSLLYDIGYASFEENPFKIEEYQNLCNAIDNQVLDSPFISNLSQTNHKFSDVALTSERRMVDYRHNLGSYVGNTGKGIIVDLFSGCGIFLIESALYATRMAPGMHISHFAFQKYPIFDKPAFIALVDYAISKRADKNSDEWNSLRAKFVGVEKNWEKLESALYSAGTAGVLELLSLTQSEYLKDGLFDAKRDSPGPSKWEYMVVKFPKMTESPPEGHNTVITNKSDVQGNHHNTKPKRTCTRQKSEGKITTGNRSLSPGKYYRLLSNLARIKAKFFTPQSRALLVLPSIMDKKSVENAFGNKLYGGKTFVRNGIKNTSYYTK